MIQIDGAEVLDVNARDRLLRSAAQRIRSCIRKTDTAARADTLRFAVIIEGPQTREQVTEIANKVVHQFDQSFVFEEGNVEVTASVGVTIYPWDAQEVERLVWNAETAMLKAHNAGGNGYRLFDEDHLPE